MTKKSNSALDTGDQEIMVMKPSEVTTLIIRAFEHGNETPIFIQGPPGVGKTALVYDAAEQLGLRGGNLTEEQERMTFRDNRISQMMPSEIRGLFEITTTYELRNGMILSKEEFSMLMRAERAEHAKELLKDNAEGLTLEQMLLIKPEAMKPRIGSLLDGALKIEVTRTVGSNIFVVRKGIMLFDEINMAPPMMTGLVQQVMQEKRMGDTIIPKGTVQIGTLNRKMDRAAIYSLPQPVNNRAYHVAVEPNMDDFMTFATRTDRIDVDIIAFLRYQDDMLYKFSAEHPAFPTPRSWENATKLHRMGYNVQMAVGFDAGTQFNGFMSVLKEMPDIDAVLAGHSRAPFPRADQAQLRYAAVTSIARRFKNFEELLNATKWIASDPSAPEWNQKLLMDITSRVKTPTFDPAKIDEELVRHPETRKLTNQMLESFNRN